MSDKVMKLLKAWLLDFTGSRGATAYSLRALVQVERWFNSLTEQDQLLVSKALRKRSRKIRANGMEFRECAKAACMQLHFAVYGIE